MIPSPLRLDKYFFSKIHVDITEEKQAGSDPRALTTKCNVMSHKKDAARWFVVLDVVQQRDASKDGPDYNIDIQIAGFFTVEKEYPPEKASQMVRANGPALLFGAVREMASLLTSRGPFEPVQLPSVSFVDEAQSDVKKRKGTRVKPRKKATGGKKT